MIEYVFRIDTQTKLDKIRDNHFRARRWIGDIYKREQLEQRLSELSATVGIFTICFFTNLAKAIIEVESNTYKPPLHSECHDKAFVLRCPKASMLSIGLTENEDYAFGVGNVDTNLFWIEESLLEDDQPFSSAGIPLHQFEVLMQGQWHPLQNKREAGSALKYGK